jgi:two-component system, chemotaxis family, sensor kinase CheA
MSIVPNQFMQTFIAEAHELLQEMEEILLHLENGPHDAGTIDALFRAAHTVKGSAGMFNLKPIVNFAHIVEDLLDRMRDGEVEIEADLIAVLLDSCDHMLQLVRIIAEQGEQPDDAALARDSGLRKRLQAYQADARAGDDDPQGTRVTLAAEEDIPLTASGGEVSSDNWHISLRFAQSVLKEGLDPLYMIRYLSNIGKIVSITTLADSMPEAEEMDEEACYLGFEIDLKSDADKETIAEVFEFAHQGSLIHILPPHSKTTEYVELIRTLPEDGTRLGEILVATGALTQHELEDGLSAQQNSVQADGTAALLGEILIDQGSVIQEVVQAALDKQTQTKASKSKESRYLRVQADKLDELIDLVGELVIAGAGANMLAHRSNNTPLQEATSVISSLVEDIRDSALNLRMVQIGETFNRFQRVVRDVGLELGKNIDLVITGAETELDKTLIEKIGDPLMHLVRNAIDHGIEPAEQRLAAGKPAQGTLRLNAYHDSGSIAIEISDDGAGLNRDKILQKAKQQGLIPDGATLSDQEIYDLIFEAGFSTADAVTSLSGRGVGMDVVRRNITALRGTVQLDSEPGLGTTVRIRLPLTLAIIDGFRVGVGRSSYVVPLDMVQECIELSEAERRAAHERSYLNLRGEVLPYVSLRDHFEVPAHFEVKGSGARRENVVVVQYAGQKAGLVVDELMGEFQTVIKPLGKIFSNLRGISGSTILGSGEVALILDVPSLVQQAVARESRQISRKQANNPATVR